MLTRKWPRSGLFECSIVEHYRPPHCEAVGRASPALPSKARQVISSKNGNEEK